MDEAQLIQSAADGDQKAFFCLSDSHCGEIYLSFLRAPMSSDDALDLTRETFLRAWHGISLYQNDPPFSSWLTQLSADVLKDMKPSAFNSAETGTTVPPQLPNMIRRAIRQDTYGFSLRALAGRFRFTILALIIILIILLVSRWMPNVSEKDDAVKPTPVKPAVSVDAALIPGDADSSLDP